jgi:hypothetical protein
MRIKLVRTSLAMPEQYDAFDESGEQVGYLRLRHGRFRVDFPSIGGRTILEASPHGDGIFDDDERDLYLQQACDAIAEKICPEQRDGNSWFVVDHEDLL